MDSLNRSHSIIHADIKPENVLIIGMSKEVQRIIKEFKSIFHKTYNSLKKKRKKHALRTAARNTINKMKTIHELKPERKTSHDKKYKYN